MATLDLTSRLTLRQTVGQGTNYLLQHCPTLLRRVCLLPICSCCFWYLNLTFSSYFLLLSVFGAKSWLCQLLYVFLLSMRDQILVNHLTDLFTASFLFTLLEHIVCWPAVLGHSFSLEFVCWHSKKVIYSNTKFIKWCSVVSFLYEFRMLKFKECLESSPSFWTAALQTKCQKLAESTILRETSDRKIEEKKEER